MTRVLHVERRAVLFRGDALAAVLRQRRRAARSTTRSTFIRAFFNNIGFRGYQFQTAPYPPPGPGPRSQTLLNSVLDLLAAYQAGRVQSYRDVIELSHQP